MKYMYALINNITVVVNHNFNSNIGKKNDTFLKITIN